MHGTVDLVGDIAEAPHAYPTSVNTLNMGENLPPQDVDPHSCFYYSFNVSSINPSFEQCFRK